MASLDGASLKRPVARALSAREVWIIGYRQGHFLGGDVLWSLAHARAGVHLLPRAGETLGENLVDAVPEELVILFGILRSVRALQAALINCAKRGSAIAVFADSTYRSPNDIDLSFEIRSRNQGSVDEHVTLMTVLHLLIAAGDRGGLFANACSVGSH